LSYIAAVLVVLFAENYAENGDDECCGCVEHPHHHCIFGFETVVAL